MDSIIEKRNVENEYADAAVRATIRMKRRNRRNR